MFAQCRFDLAQFDAMATQLDLMVETSEEFEIAVALPANTVTGAVQPLARVKGIIDESLGGQLGVVHRSREPARDLRRRGSPATPRGDQPAPAIEHMTCGVRYRLSDRNRLRVLGHSGYFKIRGKRCVFGRSIDMQQMCGWTVVQDRPHSGPDRDGLAAEEQAARRDAKIAGDWSTS